MRYISLALLCFFCSVLNAQEVQFGKISKEDLASTKHHLDSTAHAAYLYKYKSSYYDYTTELVLVTVVHERIKIYDSEGFDYAQHEISLYKGNGTRERVSTIKGYTYHIEDGKQKRTKLEKSQVFRDQTSESRSTVKFTMPDVDDGVIVEYKYTITSPFYFSIDDIQLQYDIPVDNFYSKLKIIDYLKFKKYQQGYYPFQIQETSEYNSAFETSDRVLIIEEKDVPALKVEPFVSNIYNYVAALDFEIAAFIVPERSIYESYAVSWEDIIKDCFDNDQFVMGQKPRSFFKEDLPADMNSMGDVEKMAYAMDLVKSHVRWNGNYGKIPQYGLRNAYKNGEGNVADINLLLNSILLSMGMDSHTILSSSRRKGPQYFPTREGLDYISVGVNSDKGFLFLDATDPYLGLNNLPKRAINGDGFLLNPDMSYARVSMTNSAPGRATTMMNFNVKEDGSIEGNFKRKKTNHLAAQFREEKAHMDEEELFEDYVDGFENTEILDYRVTGIDAIYQPLLEDVEFEMDNGVDMYDNKLLVNPFLFLKTSENPFVADTRYFPIDFGNSVNQRYIINVDLPEGYKMSSDPINTRFVLPNEIGKISFRAFASQNKLKVNMQVSIDKPIIPSMYYEYIQAYFDFLIENTGMQMEFIKEDSITAAK